MVLLTTFDGSKSLTNMDIFSFFIVFLIIFAICLFIGLIWIIIKSLDMLKEKEIYYRNLNKRLKKEETK